MGSTEQLLPVLTKTQFNLNNSVCVRLTDRGKEILLESVLGDMLTPAVDEAEATIGTLFLRGEEYQFQLYEFMSIFGPHLPRVATSSADYALFESNNVVLIPDSWDIALRSQGA